MEEWLKSSLAGNGPQGKEEIPKRRFQEFPFSSCRHSRKQVGGSELTKPILHCNFLHCKTPSFSSFSFQLIFPRTPILQPEVEEAGGGKPSNFDLENPFSTHHLFNFPHLFANSRPILMSFRVPIASSQAGVGAAGSCWVGSRWGKPSLKQHRCHLSRAGSLLSSPSRASSPLSAPSFEHCEHPHDRYHDSQASPISSPSTILQVVQWTRSISPCWPSFEDGGGYLICGQGCNWEEWILYSYESVMEIVNSSCFKNRRWFALTMIITRTRGIFLLDRRRRGEARTTAGEGKSRWGSSLSSKVPPPTKCNIYCVVPERKYIIYGGECSRRHTCWTQMVAYI